MIPNPIFKALSTMRTHRVRCLLMGGQACVFYGAAEFSRDLDLAILAEPENLRALRAALDELQGEVIAVPAFNEAALTRGHAVHFRCHHPEAVGLRVDVMAKMRGVDEFPSLWERRTIIESFGVEIEMLSVVDLVRAKKTQRDKDWPMIQRLVEAHFTNHQHEASGARVRFWLQEARTPALLRRLTEDFRTVAVDCAPARPVLRLALEGADDSALDTALDAERRTEMALDRAYWLPLRLELEEFRRLRLNQMG